MKYLLLLGLITSLLFSQIQQDDSAVIEIKDTSGLNENEVRAIAEKSDEKKKEKISLKEISKITNSDGSVDVKKLQALWEDQTPKTNGYDWVKTTSGEWFKGHIKSMYDENLEFDSDEIGLYTFDFEDVAYIKSHNAINVNIEFEDDATEKKSNKFINLNMKKTVSVSGILRFDGSDLRIIQGDTEYKFKSEQIISFAPSGEKERNFWSGKVSVSLDQRKGNKNQFDFSTRVNLKRNTDTTRLIIDYLGRVSSLEEHDTANDHRITETFDVYITKRFFWTPLFSEYYTDKFQNIASQVTASTGLGYAVIDKRKLKLDISGGPGIIYTKYDAVEEGEKDRATSASIETRIKMDWEINKKNDLIYDYKFTITDNDSGAYKHHMILSLENELTSWLDLDLSFIWDRLGKPTELEDGTVPFKNDYQFLIGLGVEF